VKSVLRLEESLWWERFVEEVGAGNETVRELWMVRVVSWAKMNFIWTVHVCLGEFATYLRHVRSLKFTDKPDYVYLRNLFHDVLCKHSWECDWEFDWVAQQKVCTRLNGLALYELLTYKLLPLDSTFLMLLLLFNGRLARCTWVIWFPLGSSLCVGCREYCALDSFVHLGPMLDYIVCFPTCPFFLTQSIS